MDCGEDNSSLTHFLLSALLSTLLWPTQQTSRLRNAKNFGGLLAGELVYSEAGGANILWPSLIWQNRELFLDIFERAAVTPGKRKLSGGGGGTRIVRQFMWRAGRESRFCCLMFPPTLALLRSLTHLAQWISRNEETCGNPECTHACSHIQHKQARDESDDNNDCDGSADAVWESCMAMYFLTGSCDLPWGNVALCEVDLSGKHNATQGQMGWVIGQNSTAQGLRGRQQESWRDESHERDGQFKLKRGEWKGGGVQLL